MEIDNDLQSDQTGSNEAEPEMIENQVELGAESDPASEPEHESNSADAEPKPVNQDAIDSAIGKQHAKYREEQRRRLDEQRRRVAAEAELNKLKSSQAQSDPEPKLHEVDPYSQDMEEELKLRDESVMRLQAWKQRQERRLSDEQSYNQQVANEKAQLAKQRTEKFIQSARELKVSEQEVISSAQEISKYQLGNEVSEYIMDDDKGVQIMTALSKNPVMLSELALMPIPQRILHIERNIRAKLNVSPRISQSKPPATRVKGKASDASDKYPLTGGKVRIE